MLKKILSVTVALAMCLVLSTVMPLANAAEITGFDGEGTEESPYLIKSAADMQRLAETVNGGNDCSGIYFKMTDDIDLSGVCGEDIDGEEVSWTPIGGFKVNLHVFSGIFDGNGKNISGLYINAPSGSFLGLFGYVDGGTVKNLSVDGYVKCNSNSNVGGIAGQNNGGTIENCSNSCAVSNGTNYIGGIVGYSYEGTLRNCSNTGTISGRLAYIGGIVGYQCEGSVTNCHNTGTVTGNNNAAGIAGVADRSTITNCYNTGSISSQGGYTGGIAGVSLNGAMSTAIVENCYNTGCISSAYYVGGVVGSFGASSGTIIIKNCYSTGDTISTGYEAGGVLGNIYYLQIGIIERTYLEIQNCYYQEDKANTALGYDPADDEPKERVTKSVNAEARPELSFTCGEMAYLLQGLQEEESGLVWGQRITTKGEHDGSPILTDNEAYRVLKVTFMNGAETLAEQYANPGKLKPPTENFPALSEGYEVGWSTDPSGESKIYYDTVTIGSEDTVFYAIIGIPPERPELTPPEARENLVYNDTEQELLRKEAQKAAPWYTAFLRTGIIRRLSPQALTQVNTQSGTWSKAT